MLSLLDFAKKLGLILLGLGLLLSGTLRGWLLPFALSLLTAASLDRPVSRLADKLPRWLAALAIMTLASLLLLCALALLAVRLWQDIPAALSGFSGQSSLLDRLEEAARRLPAFLQGISLWLLGQLRSQGSALSGALSGWFTRAAGSWARGLPGFLLSLGVWLLASFYTLSDWQRVRAFLVWLIPSGWRPGMGALLRRLRRGALSWLGTQGRLLAVSFLLLAGGLSLLRIPGAWTWAVGIALADALPVLGSGVVLVPWGFLAWIQGDGRAALGLFALWLTVSLARTLLEPRLLGKEMGAPPLITLLVLYGGLQLGGIPGLILGPILLSAGLAALRG